MTVYKLHFLKAKRQYRLTIKLMEAPEAMPSRLAGE